MNRDTCLFEVAISCCCCRLDELDLGLMVDDEGEWEGDRSGCVLESGSGISFYVCVCVRVCESMCKRHKDIPI